MGNTSVGTASAASGSATLHGNVGVITSESLTTAANGTYTLTIGCNQITPKSVVIPVLSNGSNTQGDPTIATVTPGESKVVVTVVNRHATQALNGTLKISFFVP